MKKTYIKPDTTVVSLNVRDNVMQVGSIKGTSGAEGFEKGEDLTSGEYNAGGRDVINTPDAWEEW